LNLCVLRPTRVHNPNGKSIGSAVFAQLTAESRRVHWRSLANTIELLPLAHRVNNPNGKSIGSAVSAQLTAESFYTLEWATLPQNCPLMDPDGDPHLIQDSLGASPSPQSKGHHDRFSRFCTADRRVSLYFKMGRPSPSKLPFQWGIWTSIYVVRRTNKFNHIRQVAPVCPHGKAHWRHLAKTTEPSVCGGDAVLSQITLTTC